MCALSNVVQTQTCGCPLSAQLLSAARRRGQPLGLQRTYTAGQVLSIRQQQWQAALQASHLPCNRRIQAGAVSRRRQMT
jgi:hypothetical protein